MKKLILSVAILLFLNITIQAQSETIKDSNQTEIKSKKVFSPQTTGDDVKIKDDEDNTLLKVIDEGSFGSIEMQNGVPISTTNKIYNNSGTLHFNGTALGSGFVNEIDDLSDAKYDGASLFLGYESGISDDGTDNHNIGIGRAALKFNTSGYYNVAIGNYALISNSTGWYNTAIGYVALNVNQGISNTAIGSSALQKNTSGSSNTSCGFQSLYENITGYRNTAFGFGAIRSNTSGFDNSAMGYNALSSNTTGRFNTAIGMQALNSNKTGFFNSAIGDGAGPNSDNLSNTTALGFSTITTSSNQVRIGNSSVTSIGGYQDWTNISDIRYKQNIQENVTGIEFVMGLKPITYNLNVEAIAEKLGENNTIDDNGNRVKREISTVDATTRQKKSNMRKSGFAAQEVEELANKLGYDFGGVDKPENEDSFYGLRYAEFVVPLVKAIQEQQEMINTQNQIIAELRKEVDGLKRNFVK